MKYTTKLLIVFMNIVMGFVSFWWFILSYATAINVDHKEDAEQLIPFGIVALIILPIIMIGSNWAFYKHKNKKIKSLVLIQIIPFVLGFAVSFLSTIIRN